MENLFHVINERNWLLGFVLSYFLYCQGIILVYDITDEKSFENIQNWMKSIKEVRGKDFVFC